MAMVPESIGSSRLMARHNVDLPDPDGPSTTMTWPRGTSRLMSLSTWRSPKCLSTAFIEIIAWLVGAGSLGADAASSIAMGSDTTQVTRSSPGSSESGEFGVASISSSPPVPLGRDFDGGSRRSGFSRRVLARALVGCRRLLARALDGCPRLLARALDGAYLSGPYLRLPDDRARLRAPRGPTRSRRLRACRRRRGR